MVRGQQRLGSSIYTRSVGNVQRPPKCTIDTYRVVCFLQREVYKVSPLIRHICKLSENYFSVLLTLNITKRCSKEPKMVKHACPTNISQMSGVFLFLGFLCKL